MDWCDGAWLVELRLDVDPVWDFGKKEMERAAGIEPACLTWKDSALPLSYARVDTPTIALQTR